MTCAHFGRDQICTQVNRIRQEFNFSVACHCMFSNPEGLGTSVYIMGLATIDPHSQKEHIDIYKIPKFGVNRASFDRDTAIQKRQN